MSTPTTIKAEYLRATAAEKTLTDNLATEAAARVAADRVNADAIAALAAKVAALTAPVVPPVTPPVIVPGPFPLSLQAAIDSAAPGAVIDVTGGPVYPPYKGTKSNITLIGPEIAGAGPGHYVEGNNGLWFYGTAGSPLVGLSIIRPHVHGVGKIGILVEHATNFHIDDATTEDCVYGGVIVFSGLTGSIARPVVRRIGFAVPPSELPEGQDSYGVMLGDQGGPPSADIVVDHWLVEDIPNFHGLNTHGGQRITFSNGVLRRVRRGMFLTASPDSGAYATDLKIIGNQLLSPGTNPLATTPLTLVSVHGATFQGNTITGWGAGKTDPGKPWYDFQGQSTGLVDAGGNVVTA